MYTKCHMPLLLENHYKKANEALKPEKEVVNEELEKTKKEMEELKSEFKKKKEEVANLMSYLDTECQSREDAIRMTIEAE